MRWRPRPRPDPDELRELHACAQILERLALERAAPFDAAAVAELRAANARLAEVADHAARAVVADHQVRGLLTEPCGDARLLALLAEVRLALLPHRRPALASPARVLRRAAEHEAIIGAVARGERRAAAGLLHRSAGLERDVLLGMGEAAPPRVRVAWS